MTQCFLQPRAQEVNMERCERGEARRGFGLRFGVFLPALEAFLMCVLSHKLSFLFPLPEPLCFSVRSACWSGGNAEVGRNLLVFTCSSSATELFFIGAALGGLALQFQWLYCEP